MAYAQRLPRCSCAAELATPGELTVCARVSLPFLSPGAHFLCDTLDITRPFPSYRAVKEPSWDLVWNRWLSTPFRNLGLDHLCPPLLQVQC